MLVMPVPCSALLPGGSRVTGEGHGLGLYNLFFFFLCQFLGRKNPSDCALPHCFYLYTTTQSTESGHLAAVFYREESA